MTARIVTTTYSYKRPPKRKGRKLAEIPGPAVITAKGSRRPVLDETAAEVDEAASVEVDEGGGGGAVNHGSAALESRKRPAPSPSPSGGRVMCCDYVLYNGRPWPRR